MHRCTGFASVCVRVCMLVCIYMCMYLPVFARELVWMTVGALLQSWTFIWSSQHCTQVSSFGSHGQSIKSLLLFVPLSRSVLLPLKLAIGVPTFRNAPKAPSNKLGRPPPPHMQRTSPHATPLQQQQQQQRPPPQQEQPQQPLPQQEQPQQQGRLQASLSSKSTGVGQQAASPLTLPSPSLEPCQAASITVIDLTQDTDHGGGCLTSKSTAGRPVPRDCGVEKRSPSLVLVGCRVSVTGFGREGRQEVAELCAALGAVYRPGERGTEGGSKVDRR